MEVSVFPSVVVAVAAHLAYGAGGGQFLRNTVDGYPHALTGRFSIASYAGGYCRRKRGGIPDARRI